jgi:hypothetical protein
MDNNISTPARKNIAYHFCKNVRGGFKKTHVIFNEA